MNGLYAPPVSDSMLRINKRRLTQKPAGSAARLHRPIKPVAGLLSPSLLPVPAAAPAWSALPERNSGRTASTAPATSAEMTIGFTVRPSAILRSAVIAAGTNIARYILRAPARVSARKSTNPRVTETST